MKKFKFNGFFEKLQNKHKMRKAIEFVQNSGHQIKTVYDIGANAGKWTRDMSKILTSSEFIMFEANEIHRPNLSKRGFPFFIEILSSEEQERKFFSIGGTGDSLYLENTRFYEEKDFRWVKTKTLRSVINENSLSKPNFIKLDVQGAEIEILQGAEDMIDECSLIYMECPILEYNIGAPTFDTYVKYMRSLNFSPLQILEQHLIEGELVQFDIIFINRAVKDDILKSLRS